MRLKKGAFWMNYLVTRHPGALQWLKTQSIEPFVPMAHLHNPDLIAPGDIVMGTLPLYLIAAVCTRGARYFHLDVALPDELRGTELTAQQLTGLNAELVEYSVQRHLPDRQGEA